MKYQSELLELAMPTDLRQIGEEDFYECMYELVIYVSKCKKVISLLLYIEMMMRTIAYPRLRVAFLSFH